MEDWKKEKRIFVERLVKFASEQVRMGRNYGWSVDTLAEELDNLIQSEREAERAKVLDKVERDVIGDNVDEDRMRTDDPDYFWRMCGQNDLRDKQRALISKLKEEEK